MMIRGGVGRGGDTHSSNRGDEGRDDNAFDHDDLSPSMQEGHTCPPALERFSPARPGHVNDFAGQSTLLTL